MITADKPVTEALVLINGTNRPHITAAVQGNLPNGWYARQLCALPTGSDPWIAVTIEAQHDDALRMQVGAKVVLNPPVDHLGLADELARQLCDKIRRSGPGRVRIALDPGAIMPTRGSDGSSGYDLHAPVDVTIRVRQTVVLDTGVHFEFPDDTWTAFVMPRSGMSKRGLWVQVGVVDGDYRGSIGANVINLSPDDQRVGKGDRVAQIVISRACHPAFDTVDLDVLTPTARGARGWGSTGK